MTLIVHSALPYVLVHSSLFRRTLLCGGYLCFRMYFTLTFHIMIRLVLPMISKIIPVSYEEDIEQYISQHFLLLLVRLFKYHMVGRTNGPWCVSRSNTLVTNLLNIAIIFNSTKHVIMTLT